MRRSSILVLGDPGPVRSDLLMRSDVELLWMNRLEEALLILRESTPNICLIGPEITAQDAHQMLVTGASRNMPCLVLVNPGPRKVEPRLALRAAAVIPVRQIEAVLAMVAFYTGLTFAKDARAWIEAPVRVIVGGAESLLETANLSVSGVAIRGFPCAAAGTVVRLELHLPGGTVYTAARVVRWASEQQTSIAGLQFQDLSTPDRERIQALVENETKNSAGSQLRMSDLFGDLPAEDAAPAALSSADLHRSSDVQDEQRLFDVARERGFLETFVNTGIWAAEAEDWLQHLGRSLTAVEIAAVQGIEAPAWALPAVNARLCLARARLAAGETGLPAAVSAEAYRVFVELAQAAHGAPSVLVAQIAKIRALILRDLLARGRMRSGMGPAPVPLGADPLAESLAAPLRARTFS